MIYLNFNNLDSETQQRLLSLSKKDVEIRFGNDLKRYSQEHCTSYDILLEEEAIRNLYTYKFEFKV